MRRHGTYVDSDSLMLYTQQTGSNLEAHAKELPAAESVLAC